MEKISKKKIIANKISFMKRKKANKPLHIHQSTYWLPTTLLDGVYTVILMIYYENKNNVRDLSTVITVLKEKKMI